MKRNSIVVLLAIMTCSVWASAQEAPRTRVAPETQSTSQAHAQGSLWSANESIGADVVNANGEDLGKVEDIVLDRDKSRIAYLIVSYGGILGIGDKHFAVPWQAFGQTADRDLSLGINQDQLKNAPGFEKGTLPNTADPLFHEGVYSFYNVQPYSLEQRQERARADATQDQSSDRSFDWTSWVSRGDDTTWARRLDDLIGTNIENAQGDTIAELEDVIVDSREGRAAFAVVSYGGTLGFFEDTTIIPWNALRLDLAREAYVTDVTLAQLEQAKLSDTEYRNLEDRNYSASLFSTFRTQPYWEEFGYEAERDQAVRAADAREKAEDRAEDRAEDKADAREKAQDKAEARAKADDGSTDTAANKQEGNTVIGTVVSVSNYPEASPDDQSERGLRVRVRTESGSIRTVHLANNEELQRQDLTLKRGDKVVITCDDRDYRGHKVLSAREVQKDGKTVKFAQ